MAEHRPEPPETPETPDPPQKPRRKHDQVLKAFFAHPLAARSLVRDFMARGWHRQLDLDALREMPTEHVSPDGPSIRRIDAAWWVPFRNHRRAVVFHVEYQSSVAHDMLFRNLEYVADIYRFLKANAQWQNPDGTLRRPLERAARRLQTVGTADQPRRPRAARLARGRPAPDRPPARHA